MKFGAPTLALLALLCSTGQCAGPDTHLWQCQRPVRLAMPAVEQCVVLDAALYARAAPGLRDVRLLQDGRLLAYALEESYDEHTSPGGKDDRAQYTTVLRLPLTMDPAEPGLERAAGVLPRRVPVERILLVPAQPLAPSSRPEHTAELQLRVQPSGAATEPEFIQADVRSALPSVQTAIGANLQGDAAVSIAVHAATGGAYTAVELQMRQRSLCFQPLSSATPLLLFGNMVARPVHYDYAAQYRPLPAPVLAQLGPVERNQSYSAMAPQVHRTLARRAWAAAALALVLFLLLPMLVRR